MRRWFTKGVAGSITVGGSCLVWLASSARAGTDLWDLPPLRYSDTQATDVLAGLARDLATGKTKVEGETELERLRLVLKYLRVPEESQILVVSKPRHQNSLIRPSNPRGTLYFSMNA
jgi:hypothetical protein